MLMLIACFHIYGLYLFMAFNNIHNMVEYFFNCTHELFKESSHHTVWHVAYFYTLKL